MYSLCRSFHMCIPFPSSFRAVGEQERKENATQKRLLFCAPPMVPHGQRKRAQPTPMSSFACVDTIEQVPLFKLDRASVLDPTAFALNFLIGR